jgi:hypothetical protein
VSIKEVEGNLQHLRFYYIFLGSSGFVYVLKQTAQVFYSTLEPKFHGKAVQSPQESGGRSCTPPSSMTRTGHGVTL